MFNCGVCVIYRFRLRAASGFSLIELLVVIGVIGILAAIAIPQYANYRNRSFKARTQSDLRHVSIAEEAYFVDNERYLSCTDAVCPASLDGILALSQGVTLQITATTTGFTGSASHSAIDEVCLWDNSSRGFLGCS